MLEHPLERHAREQLAHRVVGPAVAALRRRLRRRHVDQPCCRDAQPGQDRDHSLRSHRRPPSTSDITVDAQRIEPRVPTTYLGMGAAACAGGRWAGSQAAPISGRSTDEPRRGEPPMSREPRRRRRVPTWTPPTTRSAGPFSPNTWRHLLGAAYAAPDGRTFLIEVLKHLADENRASCAPPPLQRRAAALGARAARRREHELSRAAPSEGSSAQGAFRTGASGGALAARAGIGGVQSHPTRGFG